MRLNDGLGVQQQCLGLVELTEARLDTPKRSEHAGLRTRLVSKRLTNRRSTTIEQVRDRQTGLQPFRVCELEQVSHESRDGFGFGPRCFRGLESLLGVSAFRLGHQAPADEGEQLRLGDAFSMIPPFTGNGMTMAFQSAQIALQPLIDYLPNRMNSTQINPSRIRHNPSQSVTSAM